MGLTFIKSQTASNVCEIDFIHGTSDVVFDSTYNEYLFTIVNYKPVTDGSQLGFQTDTGTNTSYNQPMTTTAFRPGHIHSGGWSDLAYTVDYDLAQDGSGTSGRQVLSQSGESATQAEMSASGELRLFDPSNGTYVKHFYSRVNNQYTNNDTDAQTYCVELYTAGYVNTATALTRVRFDTTSGNILAGTFTLYGVS